MNYRMAKTTVLLLTLALVGTARVTRGGPPDTPSSTASASHFDDLRKIVEQSLPGGYLHSHIPDRGACSIAPVRERPGVFLFRGEGASGTGHYCLAEDNPFHLIRLDGPHPASATVVITSETVEIHWDLAGGHKWIRPR
jgi:hypothetical protein